MRLSQRKAKGMGEWEKCLREFREKVNLSLSAIIEGHLMLGHKVLTFSDSDGVVVMISCECCLSKVNVDDLERQLQSEDSLPERTSIQ
ncbi:MAG: hypothetical protein Q8O71_04280 [bacterium]|nr:hypothetical protein [bacterium]